MRPNPHVNRRHIRNAKNAATASAITGATVFERLETSSDTSSHVPINATTNANAQASHVLGRVAGFAWVMFG